MIFIDLFRFLSAYFLRIAGRLTLFNPSGSSFLLLSLSSFSFDSEFRALKKNYLLFENFDKAIVYVSVWYDTNSCKYTYKKGYSKRILYQRLFSALRLIQYSWQLFLPLTTHLWFAAFVLSDLVICLLILSFSMRISVEWKPYDRHSKYFIVENNFFTL